MSASSDRPRSAEALRWPWGLQKGSVIATWRGLKTGRGRTDAQDACDMESVELPPEGPCGFEPLHLRQASVFAGYVDVAISGNMWISLLCGHGEENVCAFSAFEPGNVAIAVGLPR